MRVVVAGQMPPPVGGQNLNIKILYEMLHGEEGLTVDYWKFDFAKKASGFRKFSLYKVVSLISVIIRLVKLRIKGDIDMIIYPTGGPHTVPIVRDIILLPLATLASRRVWVHFHAAAIADRLPTLPKWLGWALKKAHERCSGGIVLSDFGAADAVSLGLKKVVVIPIGVVEKRNFPKRELDQLTLISVGHLSEEKGTDVLIQAFGDIYKKYPNVRLRLIGECTSHDLGERLEQLIKSADCANAIELVGLLEGDDLGRAYSQADVLVFPSVAQYESYGMVIVEAMMYGLALVVADWRAAGEVFKKPRGGICYTVGEDHYKALSRALDKAICKREFWQAWGLTNREHFENSYTMLTYREKIMELIDSQRL